MDGSRRQKIRSKSFFERKTLRSFTQGIFRLWPGRIKSPLRPLADLSFATVVPFFLAIPYSVSPFDTVYLEPDEDFLDVDFEGVDFFFDELLDAVVFVEVLEVELEVDFLGVLNA